MLETGTIVSGYRVDGLLGEGGMGHVYRATQLSLNRTVALKVLAAELSDDETFRERFRREGLLQAAIDHQHIVTVYEAGETEHGLFLAMRLVRGPTLKDEILSERLTPERTMRILLAVADALDSAHEVGLIHRDVKPQNILVGARDHAYLADFGLTKVPDESVPLTGTGQFVGTIDYISPEQVRGEGADHRSDVYALAGVLYECLTGKVPYPRPTEAAVLFAHITDPPPSLREDRPDLPAELDELIAKGMAKDPAERFSTAGELMRHAAQAIGAPTEPAPAAVATAGAGQTTKPATHIAAPGDATVTRRAVTAAAGTAPTAAPARPVSRGVLAAGAGLLLVAILAGLALGSGGSDSDADSEDFANSASAGRVGVSFPSDWERLAVSPRIPGLPLSQPMTLVPQEQDDNKLTTGTTAADGASLLPASFEKRLSGEPEGVPVRMGDLEALRYQGLRPRGLDEELTVYAVPTTGAVAIAACRADPEGPAEFFGDCEQVAATLELSGMEPVPLGPSAQYARELSNALAPLGDARRSAGADLTAASTPDAQAEAARALSRAYGTARSDLGDASAGSAERDANTGITSSLGRLRTEYARLASAAESADSASYASASQEIGEAEQKLQRSLDELSELGYDVS